MKTTLTNDFHHTRVTVNVPANGLLSARQTKRVYRELCGQPDCSCGGIRGKQNLPGGMYCTEEHDRILITAI